MLHWQIARAVPVAGKALTKKSPTHERQGMTPYSCRHTFITRAIRAGVELPVLEAIVGHVDRETTKINTHLHADDLVEAVQSIRSKTSAVGNKSATRSEGSKNNIQKSS